MKVAIYNHQYLRGACPGCYKYYLEGLKKDAQRCVAKAVELFGENCEIINYTDLGPYPNDSIDRPGYRRMIESVKNHEFDVLVIFKLGTISTDISHIMETYKILKENNVRIITALDGEKAQDFLEEALKKYKE